MALQIRKPATAFSKQPTGKSSGRIEDKDYLEWVRSLPCVVTGTYPVEAAHISFPSPQHGKLGRGFGRKENDRWAIPLSVAQHRLQHSKNEVAYWSEIGIDPCAVALSLWGVYTTTRDQELAELILTEARRRRKRNDMAS